MRLGRPKRRTGQTKKKPKKREKQNNAVIPYTRPKGKRLIAPLAQGWCNRLRAWCSVPQPPFFFFFFFCYFSFFFLSFFFRFLSASLLGREKEKESESVCEGKHETIDYHFSKVRALDLDLLGLFDSDFFSRGSARLWAIVSNFF